MITVCCVCRRTKFQEGWRAARIPQGAILSHGYCRECGERLMSQIEQWLAQRQNTQRQYHQIPI